MATITTEGMDLVTLSTDNAIVNKYFLTTGRVTSTNYARNSPTLLPRSKILYIACFSSGVVR